MHHTQPCTLRAHLSAHAVSSEQWGDKDEGPAAPPQGSTVSCDEIGGIKQIANPHWQLVAPSKPLPPPTCSFHPPPSTMPGLEPTFCSLGIVCCARWRRPQPYDTGSPLPLAFQYLKRTSTPSGTHTLYATQRSAGGCCDAAATRLPQASQTAAPWGLSLACLQHMGAKKTTGENAIRPSATRVRSGQAVAGGGESNGRQTKTR